MADDFSAMPLIGPIPSFFPTDTENKLVPVFNGSGRFTGQLQKNGRIAVDVGSAEEEGQTDQTQVLLSAIQGLLTTLEGVSLADQMREATRRLSDVAQSLRVLGRELIVDITSQAAPGANTDILNGIAMRRYPGVTALAVTITLATASVLNYTKCKGVSDLSVLTIGINSSVALNAGDVYTFLIPVGPDDFINLQVETDSVITQLLIEGVYSGIR